MNVINELRSFLGPIYQLSIGIGGMGMFVIPVLAVLSLKGGFIKISEKVQNASQLFLAVGKVFSVFSILPWIGAIFFIFPGIFFCSVFCFLGLALPILGISTALTCGFLILGFALNPKYYGNA